MRTLVRLRRCLFEAMLADLHRPHAVAAERVGFLYGPLAVLSGELTLVLPTRYAPVPDEEYLDDSSVGARIDTSAMRRAMQHTLSTGACCFHVHQHDHDGVPHPSGIDRRTIERFAPSLQVVAASARHGGLVLSETAATAIVWSPTAQRLEHARVSIVGTPLWLGAEEGEARHERVA